MCVYNIYVEYKSCVVTDLVVFKGFKELSYTNFSHGIYFCDYVIL